MPKEISTILVTAIMSAVIFIAVFSFAPDFILIFLSTIPLLAAGLSKNPTIALKSGVIATVLIGLFVADEYPTYSIITAALFFSVFVLPCWYICDRLLHHFDIKLSDSLPYIRIWYPVGLITIYMAIYGCILLAIVTAIFATQDTNLPKFITQTIEQSLAIFSEKYGVTVEYPSESFSFILSGAMVWLWCVFFLAYAWAINRLLIKKNIARRPAITLSAFPIPNWLLTLMSICAIASLIGGESMRFLGKSSLIILLIPYFFQGIFMIHASTINFPNRRVFLIFLYFLIATSFWLPLVVAGVGLWHHIKTFNKHLSSGGSSSKS